MTGVNTYYYPAEEPGAIGNGRCRLEIIETWEDINNTSSFVVNFQAKGSGSGTWSHSGNVKVNDVDIVVGNVTKSLSSSEWSTMYTVNIDGVEHDANGELTIVITSIHSDGKSNFRIYSNNSNLNLLKSDDTNNKIVCHKNEVAKVHIDTGNGFETYTIYIDDGEGWVRHTAYIDTGTEWVKCI